MPRSGPRTRRTPRIEVRSGRRGRSLRLDGTFASWYAPGSALTGSVWDALAAPLLCLPPQRRRSVLLLGLGGGSAARVARLLAPRAHIVGVELVPEVVQAARRWFDLDELGIEVAIADARDFLERENRRFDAVIDDVFIGSGRRVHKPAWLPEPGLALASRRLARGGVLVSNALDEAPAVSRAMGKLLPGRLRIEVAGYDNRILVGGPARLDARLLRAELAALPEFETSLRSLRLRTLPAGRPGLSDPR